MMLCSLLSTHTMVLIEKYSRNGLNELDQVCRISRHDFRTKIIKKSIGAVCKVVLTSGDCSDDQLLANLRSCFSDAPTMNQAREDLRNMRQQEKEISHGLHLQMG